MTQDIQAWIADHMDFIQKYQQDIIEINTSDESILLGDSKIGGMPDLPLDYDWPEYEGKAMTFFAQINLKEIANLQDILPSSGWLFFFVHFDEPGKYGANWQNIPPREKYAVRFFDGLIKELEEYYYPKNLLESLRFPASKIYFRKKFMLPSSREAIVLKDLNWEEADLQALASLRNFKRSSNAKLLGYPQAVQYDVLYDWSSQYLKDYAFSQEEKTQAFAENKAKTNEFICLLEFDCSIRHYYTETAIEPVFPDFKKIGEQNFYFGILKEDLEALNFDNALLVFQST